MGKQSSCFFWDWFVGPGLVLGQKYTVSVAFAPRVWACRPHEVLCLFEGPDALLGCFIIVPVTILFDL